MSERRRVGPFPETMTWDEALLHNASCTPCPRQRPWQRLVNCFRSRGPFRHEFFPIRTVLPSPGLRAADGWEVSDLPVNAEACTRCGLIRVIRGDSFQ